MRTVELEEWIAASVIEFENGDIEAMVLARGDGKKCESVANMVPGITYNGDKKVKGARVVVMKASSWDAIANKDD